MQILDAASIRAWDEYTIQHEPVSSLELMERAAKACVTWLMENGFSQKSFTVFCGKGNNGGDGLVIARLLAITHHDVQVRILEFGNRGTEDFQANLSRLHETKVDISFISSEESVHPVEPGRVIIDALFGSGLNKPVSGLSAAIVAEMNRSGNDIISIDIPSGMYVDKDSDGSAIVRATATLSFQCYKRAFLAARNGPYIGRLSILDIGLHPGFFTQHPYGDRWVNMDWIKQIFKHRLPFSHKGNYGYGALLAGSEGMMGAAVLAASACLHAGAGKLTCLVPSVGYTVLQSTVPEAMCRISGDRFLEHLPDLSPFTAIAIGPGLSVNNTVANVIRTALEQYKKPVVIDADGLNNLALHIDLLALIPPGSILTPHPKEFDRLFGESPDEFERWEKARTKANETGLVIVLKGRYSFIAVPGGPSFYNETGNAGMAKGGSGDVLTGIILALLCQGYGAAQAAALGTWLAGRAADIAVMDNAYESFLPSDTIRCLGKAFRECY